VLLAAHHWEGHWGQTCVSVSISFLFNNPLRTIAVVGPCRVAFTT
jgi:hypothetical protein